MAIIGGGFSGLMVAAHAVCDSPRTPRIFWAAPDHPRYGTAYMTKEPHHLLNVRAARMGAWAGRESDFWLWLQENHAGRFREGDYVPRMIYGEYLHFIYQQTREAAGEKITQTAARIADARKSAAGWDVTDEAGETITARHLVLATGNPPIADLGWPRSGVFIADFWNWRLNQDGRIESGALPEESLIVIVGTGLTAADAALSLLADGFKGRLLAVSPHGHWPAVHGDQSTYSPPPAFLPALQGRPAPMNYLRQVRHQIEAAPPGEWRTVINSLRPHTAALWRALPESEKNRASRHLLSFWNIHRHRMAPEIKHMLEETGRVGTLAGRVLKALPDGTLTFRPRGSTITQTLKATRVINCTGPAYRRMLADNPVLAALSRAGHIKPGPLGLGLCRPDDDTLHALGPLLLGEDMETVAVPELREQAAAIAGKITAGL